jgi:hypothetical protein
MDLLNVSNGDIKTFGYKKVSYVKLNLEENDNIYEMFLLKKIFQDRTDFQKLSYVIEVIFGVKTHHQCFHKYVHRTF